MYIYLIIRSQCVVSTVDDLATRATVRQTEMILPISWRTVNASVKLYLRGYTLYDEL